MFHEVFIAKNILEYSFTRKDHLLIVDSIELEKKENDSVMVLNFKQ